MPDAQSAEAPWPARSPGRQPHRQLRRPAPPRRPRFIDFCAGLAGIGFGAVLAAVLAGESSSSLAAPGGKITALGRLAGFTGTYLLLIMIVLAARLPWLERSVGQDQLIRWHRKVASWAITLICAHVIFITFGYAQAVDSPWLHEIWVLLTSYRDVLAAAAGFGLLVLAAATSYRYVRNRLKYETWWVVHLYLYLALALAFAHQIVTGTVFIGHPLTRALWIVVWAATAGLVLVFRIGNPILLSLRHRLEVVEVRDEAPGVVSVICRGRNLDKLAVSGGQFFQWRFLTKGLWWQAHPYSLSALPRPPYLRVTIKGLGDQSRAMAHLPPGTKVAIEGPYGAFTQHVQSSEGVVLIGAGVGVTPLRALLEDLTEHTDVVALIRASTVDGLVHRDEIAALVQQRGGQLREIVGPRHRARLDAKALRRAVPDIAARDVYVCGPEGFSAEIVRAAQQLGVADEQIHTEAFGF
jgi:predicted ferric reductase